MKNLGKQVCLYIVASFYVQGNIFSTLDENLPLGLNGSTGDLDVFSNKKVQFE